MIKVYVGDTKPWPTQVNRTLEFLSLNKIDVRVIRKQIPPEVVLSDPTLRTLPLVVVDDTNRWSGHQPDKLRTLCETYVYISYAEAQVEPVDGEGPVPTPDTNSEGGSPSGDPEPT